MDPDKNALRLTCFIKCAPAFKSTNEHFQSACLMLHKVLIRYHIGLLKKSFSFKPVTSVLNLVCVHTHSHMTVQKKMSPRIHVHNYMQGATRVLLHT